jgi:hypothetical protein
MYMLAFFPFFDYKLIIVRKEHLHTNRRAILAAKCVGASLCHRMGASRA